LNLGASVLKPKSRLEAENAALRCQLNAAAQGGGSGAAYSDRLFFIQLYRYTQHEGAVKVALRPWQ
jgi:hypothetical protein